VQRTRHPFVIGIKSKMKINTLFLISWSAMLLITGSCLAQKDSIPDTRYFPPSGKEKNIAILIIGGSEGGLPLYYDVGKYTSLGYPCFMVGYFGTKNTPDRLEMIPLEYLEKAVETFKSFPEVRDKKIIIQGGSKGGELALLLASIDKNIEGVIAAVPSSVVWQGIGGKPVSSWSYKGQPVPFVPYAPFDYSKIVNSQYVELYKLSLEQKDAVNLAAIHVENIKGPVLLLSGEDDSMWPSTQMAEMIIQRLKEHNFPFRYRHYDYKDAGHTLNENNMMGGTSDGNKKARIDSEQRVMEFLNMVSKE
jgi:uncharacterized protein